MKTRSELRGCRGEADADGEPARRECDEHAAGRRHQQVGTDFFWTPRQAGKPRTSSRNARLLAEEFNTPRTTDQPVRRHAGSPPYDSTSRVFTGILQEARSPTSRGAGPPQRVVSSIQVLSRCSSRAAPLGSTAVRSVVSPRILLQVEQLRPSAAQEVNASFPPAGCGSPPTAQAAPSRARAGSTRRAPAPRSGSDLASAEEHPPSTPVPVLLRTERQVAQFQERRIEVGRIARDALASGGLEPGRPGDRRRDPDPTS